LDWLHEHEVDHFRHINTGIEHIDRDSDSGQIVLLEFCDEAGAVASVANTLSAGCDHLYESDMLGIHFLENCTHSLGVLLRHRKNDCLAG
jgi:hypothetical protein